MPKGKRKAGQLDKGTGHGVDQEQTNVKSSEEGKREEEVSNNTNLVGTNVNAFDHEIDMDLLGVVASSRSGHLLQVSIPKVDVANGQRYLPVAIRLLKTQDRQDEPWARPYHIINAVDVAYNYVREMDGRRSKTGMPDGDACDGKKIAAKMPTKWHAVLGDMCVYVGYSKEQV